LNSGEKIGGGKNGANKKYFFVSVITYSQKKNSDFHFKNVIHTFSREFLKKKKRKKEKNLDML
jgi:hypothetical protein